MLTVRAEYKFDNNKILGMLEEKVKGLPKYVSEYMYNNIGPILSRTRKDVVDYIYGKKGSDTPGRVGRGTGKLDRATIASKQRINQYAFKAGIYFDYIHAPHLASIINDVENLEITPKTGKYLTVPDYDNNPKGKSPVRVFGLKFNPMINRKTGKRLISKRTGKEATPFWYRDRVYHAGKGIKDRYSYPNILFWAKEKVIMHPKIRFAEIQRVVEESLSSKVIKNLTEKAVENFKASRGMYKPFSYSGFGG